MTEPNISAMIVFRNEESYIQNCLESLINQTYPKNKYEIVLVDGMSDDHSRNIVEKIINDYKNKHSDGLRFQLLTNEKKLLASGWNMAIRHAFGEYVVRIDAHAKAEPDFIKTAVETIQAHPDAVCVGGKLQTKAMTKQGELISMVLSSPFGIGNSKFRYSDKAQYVDTVAFGLYRKAVFEQVGCFDESFVRNQDNNMHARIREAGGKFYYDPRIKSVYYSRDSYKKMCRQGFLNGKWNIIGLKKNKGSVSLRHLIPLFFVCSLVILSIGAYFYSSIGFVLIAELILYMTCALCAALSKTKNIKNVLIMWILFPMLHISYGCGSLISILKGGR